MKIAFVWYFDKASSIVRNWRDGLRSAVEIVEKKHEVKWFLDEEKPKPTDDFDFILVWCDAQCEFLKLRHWYSGRFGVCLTAMPQDFSLLKNCDVVFCESQPILDAVRAQGIRAIKAFGTDTEYFKPNPKVEKTIEYFYPATFSPWKRQSEIAYLGPRLKCIGTVQPDGEEELNACLKNDVDVEIGYFPVSKVQKLYERTQKMIIPAVHGSERTVLEAMSNNILPEVTHPKENPKTSSYIEEYKNSGELTPRDFVLKNYSHFIYADNLLKGIENE